MFCLMTAPLSHAALGAEPSEPVSYYNDIRPIFQARCHGCHQPAKSKGDYVMTAHDQLLAGGDSGDKAIVPGDVEGSTLVELITPLFGEAEMPQKDDPLSDTEIDLIRRWIDQGARDDTPENALQKHDMDHPPVYTSAPVISSMDYSPDGELLAVSGFHEVLLLKADGSERVARLVGMSERVQSLSFSPDGTRLAVTGGLPGRMGEAQVWDVAKRELLVSAPTTFDTLYGVTWSPDGTT
ncbi:MAG: c-type cytochrome domain-containing protein, partial [Planctomycetota bacterium]